MHKHIQHQQQNDRDWLTNLTKKRQNVVARLHIKYSGCISKSLHSALKSLSKKQQNQSTELDVLYTKTDIKIRYS